MSTLPVDPETPIGFTDIPRLPAQPSADGRVWLVWCDYCKKRHVHGAEAGHRVAHCPSSDSPFSEWGYILYLDDEPKDANPGRNRS